MGSDRRLLYAHQMTHANGRAAAQRFSDPWKVHVIPDNRVAKAKNGSRFEELHPVGVGGCKSGKIQL
jgi:hypothetical protein